MLMKHSKPNVELLLASILSLILIIVILLFCDANVMHYTRYMDSDIASETLLAQVLSENGFKIPDTWYGSTAKRIISAPDLAAVIYMITDNLNLSMGLACAVMTVLLAVSMISFYKNVGFNALEIVVAVIIPYMLSRSVSNSLKIIFLYASYYVSHFIVYFIILTLYSQALKNGLKKKHVILGVVLAVINGMQGMHGILFIYLPLLCTEMIKVGIKIVTRMKVKRDGFISLLSFVLVVVSYISVRLNGSYEQSHSRNIRHSIEKLITDIFPDIVETMDLSGFNLNVLWIFIILGGLGYAILIICLIKNIIEENVNASVDNQMWALIPIIFAFLVPVLSSMFTTAESTGRYYIAQMFILGAGYAIFVRLLKIKIAANNITQNVLLTVIAIPVLLYGINSVSFYYENLIANDQTDASKNMQIINWLKENDCLYGYADFLKANEITVVSNDTVKIRALDSMTDLNGCKWLTDTRWYPPTKTTDGLTAYVLLPEEIEEFQTFLENENPTIVNYKVFDNLEVYILDKVYSMWVD